LIGIAVTIFGFAVWMTTMESKAQANTDAVSGLEHKYDTMEQLLVAIDKRLARIETLLERNLNK
jgi:hypothetical protein